LLLKKLWQKGLKSGVQKLKNDRAPKTTDEWTIEAQSKTPEFVVPWQPPQPTKEIENANDLEQYSNYKFWNSLKKDEAFQQLPKALKGFGTKHQ
jgi:hypothetical protein